MRILHYGPQLFSAPYYVDIAWQRCCMAEAMKMFSFRKNIFSHTEEKESIFPTMQHGCRAKPLYAPYTWLTIL